MGRQAVQLQEAIPLCHDGPLCKKLEEDGRRDEASFLIQAALAENFDPSTHCSICVKLLSSLHAARRIKNQLQLLQAFKSSIIQINRKKSASCTEANEATISQTTALSETDIKEIGLVYHILLEWSLGWQTPLPLSRTIRSILETIYEMYESKELLKSIFVSVFESIKVTDGNAWREPLDSLDALVSLAQLRPDPYLRCMTNASISYLCQESRTIIDVLEMLDPDQKNSLSEIEKTISKGVKVALLIKTLFQSNEMLGHINELGDLRALFWLLLRHRLTPADSFPVVGMAYGRVVYFSKDDDECMLFIASQTECALRDLHPLPRVYFLQGLAAGVPEHVWVQQSSDTASDALRLFQQFFGDTVRHAEDPEVRLAALKGLRTLVSRSLTILRENQARVENVHRPLMESASDEVLEIVLQAWENPPTRKLANALPSVFQAVVEWKEALVDLCKDPGVSDSDFAMHDDLVDRLLSQPPYRKGKYNALECLLPKVGARKILKTHSGDSSSGLLADLLAGVGDAGHNRGAMADLWAKLLQSLFVDMHQLQLFGSRQKRKDKVEVDISSCTDIAPVSKEWLETWLPSLANALVATEWKRRKQIAAFCLPRILVMVKERADAATQSFAALLTFVSNLLLTKAAPSISTKEREEHADRVLWALMEIARYSSVEKNFAVQEQGMTNPLRDAIAANLPISRLRDGLRHFSDNVRLTCFQTMQGVVKSIHDNPMECCVCEAELWKYSLPYATKSEGTEYLSYLLSRLVSFLDRLSRCEAEEIESKNTASSCSLPITGEFITQFLLGDLFVNHSAYPHSVVAKETFGLCLLECILAFSCRDTNLALESKLLSKTGSLYERKRGRVEEETLRCVMEELLGVAVVGSLFSILQSSSWEGTKAKSFDILSKLILMGNKQGIPLPVAYFGQTTIDRIRKRGLFLASSPRQRDADTGSRILAIIGLSLGSLAVQEAFVEDLIALLGQRIGQLKLSFALDGKRSETQDFPIVHGVIVALRLILESESFQVSEVVLMGMLERLSKILCAAMQFSLSVVADVHDGENLDGVEEESEAAKGIVNPGAIGANGIFSSVHRIDARELERRLASQRVIVGSWLLMKEACAALATVLTIMNRDGSEDYANVAGTLLISTLTSLKHTGAAYAAHSALQKITRTTMTNSELSKLPLQWIDRLLREITNPEKIRDSTLRRSTGYALGFLSIMRTEVTLRAVPRSVCEKVTHQILLLTLPPSHRLKEFLVTIGMSPEDPARIFSYLNKTQIGLTSGTNKTRTRVHALNVLRMMVLDAPLSQEIFPLVGDALVSAIIGYVDSEWAVRNSAGMVFAAAMLRVVDADKNGANTDLTSKKAIALSELFQSYPTLCSVLFRVLQACVNGSLRVDGGGSLPPILPILVLLYRVQPLDSCGPDVVKTMQEFFPLISACLVYRHLSVRQAAARALSNLSGGESSRPLSVKSLYSYCFQTLRTATDWNSVHGALLLFKELRIAERVTEEQLLSNVEDVSFLFALLEPISESLRAPPLCLMEIIHIFECAGEVVALRDRLCRTCQSLILWITKEPQKRLAIPGMSELCSTAANTATRMLVDVIFYDSCLPVSEKSIRELSSLLECELLDVRVTATKALKKLIYNGVDYLVDRWDRAEKRSIIIIQGLADVCCSGLTRELARDHSDMCTHPQTLRRLSRCLLELYSANLRCGKRNLSTKPSLLELGQLIIGRELLVTHEPTPLIGIAVELVSSEPTAEVLQGAMPLLQKLSSPYIPWRLRYSAACAATQLWQEEFQKDLRPLMVQLLQDEDPDVRFVVSQAVKRAAESSLSISEYALTQFIFDQNISIDDVLCFLEATLGRARSISSQLETLVDQREAACFGIYRKIFEEEDPNSYHEPALTNQASLLSVWKILSKEAKDASILPKIQLLTEISTEILQYLMSYCDFMDDLARDVFSDLHVVLLTSTARNDDNLAMASKQILESAIGYSLHPCLSRVLRLLSRGTPPTFDEMRRCCFLVKEQVDYCDSTKS